jgi:hypothetical protein
MLISGLQRMRAPKQLVYAKCLFERKRVPQNLLLARRIQLLHQNVVPSTSVDDTCSPGFEDQRLFNELCLSVMTEIEIAREIVQVCLFLIASFVRHHLVKYLETHGIVLNHICFVRPCDLMRRRYDG